MLEPPPAVAAEVFGARLAQAQRFADVLASDGVLRGVIGPHEPERIWSRHLLNCAVIGELFEIGTRVVDVGSGAGLPGLALAICRPDLRIDLVEPLQRRVAFLDDTVHLLGLAEQVHVVRGRAEEPAVVRQVGNAPWVTARAVAPLDRLVRWCLPLLSGDGHLALMRGASVTEETEAHRGVFRRAGATDPLIVSCGAGLVDPSVAVVTFGVARPHAPTKGKK